MGLSYVCIEHTWLFVRFRISTVNQAMLNGVILLVSVFCKARTGLPLIGTVVVATAITRNITHIKCVPSSRADSVLIGGLRASPGKTPLRVAPRETYPGNSVARIIPDFSKICKELGKAQCWGGGLNPRLRTRLEIWTGPYLRS